MPNQTESPAKRFLLRIALPFIGLAGLCLINQWIFRRFFNTSYLRWYVSAGPFIGLAIVAFGAAWGKVDKNVGLVSANPFNYIWACRRLAGLSLYVFGGHLRKENQDGISLLDILFGLALIAVFVVCSFA